MESNINTNIFKHLLLQKLSYAVTYSILSHLILVFVYAFIVNFSFEGSEWFKAIVQNVISISTWLYIIPFTSIIFAQIVICANTYMLQSAYLVTRFQKFTSFISLRILFLGLLHIIIGGGEIWLYLFISNGQYKDVYVNCNQHHYCLREGTFFLILSGCWTGLYYFLCCHVTDRNIVFPVVHQQKLAQFKVKFISLLKQSNRSALFPTVCYFILYYLFGSCIYGVLANCFQLQMQIEELNTCLYLLVWVFATLYIVNMNLMRLFFELFLTEPFNNIGNDSLSEALTTRNIPILQHLACLDLYLLSKWSPQRRQGLFTLAQPGAHPYAWNSIFQPAIQILIEFIEALNRASDSLLAKDEVKPLMNQKELLLFKSTLNSSLQSPVNSKYDNMKNMSFFQQTPQELDDFVQVVVEPKYLTLAEIYDSVIKATAELLNKALAVIQNLRIFKYLFDELPEVHIQQCLRNGQLIIWTSQGLANIAVASFHEDPYGIIQKDLAILIKVLFELKQSVDKLNKLPMFSRKSNGLDDFSFKMKNNVNVGVRLSLSNICNTFGAYIKDIPLPKDIVYQLQSLL